jgi:uncharacterized RDD family membrane protein YckC
MTARPPLSETSPFIGPASIGRRVGAYAIDLGLACALAALLVGGMAAIVLASGPATSPLALAMTLALGYLAVAVVMLGWILVYSAMQGGRGSIGQRLVGIRLRSADTGAPIGFWMAVLRNLVWGVAGSIVVGYFSPLFDAGPRRQGWHDRAARAVVSDVRRSDAAAAPAPFFEALAANPYVAVAMPTAGAAPATDAAARSAAFAAAATAVVRTVRPAEPSARIIAGVPGVVPAAPSDFPGMTMPFPATTTTEPLGPRSPGRPAAPASAPAFAPRPDFAPSLATAGAFAAAAAPVAVAVALADDGVLEDDGAVETLATRRTGAVPPPAQRAALYREAPVLAVLTWDDGTRMAVYGRTLYGRNPRTESGAVAIPVRDETLSLSKTHFEIGGDGNGPWIVDRHSTNGTVLVRDGSRIPLVPGLPTSLRAGDRLEFGDRTAAVGEA